MVSFLVFVIPAPIALVMEMYVFLPIKFIYDSTVVVKVKLMEMWDPGLFYTKSFFGFLDSKHRNTGE